MDSEPASKSRRAAWRAFILWLFVSVIFFGIAAYLTLDIAQVDEHTLFSPEAKKPIIPDRDSDKELQHIGIYLLGGQVRDPQEPPKVEYQLIDNWKRRIWGMPPTANLVFALPARANAILLLNHLVDPKSCSSAQPLKAESVPTDNFMVSNNDSLITVEAGSDVYYVTCQVNSVAKAETFAKRSLDLTDSAVPGDAEHAKNLSGYLPVSFVFTFEATAAEQVSFDGGYQLPLILGFESRRGLMPNFALKVFWSDVRREQFRDVLLVIIGTLVALGATTLIEGLRPVFELFNT